MKIPGKILSFQIYSPTLKTGLVIQFSGTGRGPKNYRKRYKIRSFNKRGLMLLKIEAAFGSNLGDFYSFLNFHEIQIGKHLQVQ